MMIETRNKDINTQATQEETKGKETKMKDTSYTRTEISSEICTLFLGCKKVCKDHRINR